MTTTRDDGGLPGELWQASATALAAGIATGLVSSREAIESCLGRIAGVNDRVNAVVEVLADEALAAADAADRRVAAGEPLGPLHGVPVTTKINSPQAGVATSDGIAALRDNIATVDSPQVGGLRRGGAIPIGRTNAPAFSFRWFTDNELHGLTSNPWSPDHTPGGSSGGAASALAVGMGPVAQGNDIAGSIRYPAYACGVVGLRPTVGRVPKNHRPEGEDMLLCERLYSVDGPLARTIPDLRLAMDCMTLFDPRDPVYVPGRPAAPQASRPLKVALVRDVGIAPPTPPVEQALDRAAAWLSAAGYEVEEVEVPALAESFSLYWQLAFEEFRAWMPAIDELGEDAIRQVMHDLDEVVRQMVGPGGSLAEFIAGHARRGTLIELLSVFMADYPLVLLPVSAEQAFEQHHDLGGVDAIRRLTTAHWPLASVPLLGFPALSVPTGVVSGLPVGVQVLGRRFGEEDILTAGEVIEARAGRITPIDPIVTWEG